MRRLIREMIKDKKGTTEKIEPSPISSSPISSLNRGKKMKGINGRVWSLAGQNRALPGLLSEKSPGLLQLPFLSVSFFRYNYYAYQQKHEAKNCYDYSQDKREFLEEVTCQGYGYNSLAQVRYHFPNELSTCFPNNEHQTKFTIEAKGCQGDVDWVRVRPYTETEPRIMDGGGR